LYHLSSVKSWKSVTIAISKSWTGHKTGIGHYKLKLYCWILAYTRKYTGLALVGINGAGL
jgi:hypothetical protein